MTTALQAVPSPTLTPFEPANLEQALSLATTLSKSGLIPDALKNKPADVLVVLMTGRELGIGPMQALRGISVINGKAVIGADLMVAQCLRHRDVCEFFRLLESTNVVARYQTKRVGSEPVTMEWTIEQAKVAGLAGKGPWTAHPAAMLRARASSALARAVYPDLVGGMYDQDEGQEMERKPATVSVMPAAEAPPKQTEDQVVDVTPAKQQLHPAEVLWKACLSKYGPDAPVEWNLAIESVGLPDKNSAKWTAEQLAAVERVLLGEVTP